MTGCSSLVIPAGTLKDRLHWAMRAGAQHEKVIPLPWSPAMTLSGGLGPGQSQYTGPLRTHLHCRHGSVCLPTGFQKEKRKGL